MRQTPTDHVTRILFGAALSIVVSVGSALAAQAPTIRLLRDLQPGTVGSDPAAFVDLFDETIFFARSDVSTNRAVWRTDGTTAGTVRVVDLPAGNVLTDVAEAGGRAYFLRVPSAPTGPAPSLWETDGTVAGTQMLAMIPALPGNYFTDMAVAGDHIFLFMPVDGGRGLWSFHVPTGALTKLFSDGEQAKPIVLGNRVLFFVADPSTPPQRGLSDPWISDGTVTGTRQLVDLYPGLAAGALINDGRRYMLRHRGVGYFVVQTQSGNGELWRSDGTTTGTSRLSASGDFLLGAIGDEIYSTSGNAGLVRATHTLTGRLRTVVSGPMVVASVDGAAVDGRVVFFAQVPGGQVELWSTNGSSAGTQSLGEYFQPGAIDIRSVGSRRAIVLHRFGISITDGTLAGTFRLDPSPTLGFQWFPRYPATSGGRLYFGGTAGSQFDYEPWVVDLDGFGTRAGTGLGPIGVVPDLAVTDAVIGTSMEIRADGLVSGAPSALLLSPLFPRPLRFGPDAYLYVDLAATEAVGIIATGTTWTTAVPVSTNPTLAGLPFVFQLATIDGSSPLGLSLSNSAVAWIGR